MKNKTKLQEHYVQIRHMKCPGNAFSHPIQGFSQILIWKGTFINYQGETKDMKKACP